MADRVGQQLGNYRLIRLLGRGNFAEVYLGEHHYLQSSAAIKILSTSLKDEDVSSFRQEAQTIARLLNPHIVRVLDFDVIEGIPFLVMEYAPGGTLRQRHPRGTPLALETITRYIQQIADALHYAHSHRIVHRDIKPENILLNYSGSLLLSDFGIALLSQSTRAQTTLQIAGTAAYMAPEQFQGKAQRASDQYALGIMVYEWLCGERPFYGSFVELIHKQMYTPPQPLHVKVPTIPPAVEEVVMTALAKDPRQRFPYIQVFADAWTQACSLRPASISPPYNSPQASDALLPPQQTQQAADSASLANPPRASTMKAPLQPVSQETMRTPTVTDGQSDSQPAQSYGVFVPAPIPAVTDRPIKRIYPRRGGITRRSLLWGIVALAAGTGIAGSAIWWWLEGSQGSQQINSSGAMFGFDLQHSHVNPHETILSPQNVSRLEVGWKVSTDNAVDSSPAVVNGIVYIGSKDFNLYAFEAATGKVVWSAPTNGRIDSSPAVANGVAYFGSYDHNIYAVDISTGKLKWTAPTQDSIYSSSPAVADGVVYIGSRDHNLYALDASTGQQRWIFPTKDVITSSPAVANGVVYIGSYDHNLYAIDASTGKLRLQFTTGDLVSSSPTISNGIVYIGSEDHNLYAFESSTSKMIWMAHTHNIVISAPAIANGVVYFGSYDKNIYAVDAANGNLRWQVTTDGAVASSPLIANGVVYIGSKDGNLYALDASSGQVLAKLPTGGAVVSSPTVANGVVYVGSEDNILYAFHLPG